MIVLFILSTPINVFYGEILPVIYHVSVVISDRETSCGGTNFPAGVDTVDRLCLNKLDVLCFSFIHVDMSLLFKSNYNCIFHSYRSNRYSATWLWEASFIDVFIDNQASLFSNPMSTLYDL